MKLHLKLIKLGALFFALICVSACASLSGKNSFELQTQPTGAEVSTLAGEKLGQTPLRLTEEQFTKAQVARGKVGLRLVAPGFMEREVILETHGEDSFEVKLTAVSDEYFSKKLISDFSKQTNAMVREILQIQGFLITRNTAQAEKALETFQKKFPDLAAGFVMAGNVELMKGNRDKARALFMRAQTIDPTDPVAARLVRQAGGQ